MYLQVLRTYYAEYLCAKLLFKLHDIHDTMFGVQEEEPINKIFHLSLSEVEPDYDPYVTTNNGVLQIVDVRNKKIIYNDQVKGWSMRGKVGASQNTQLLLDMAFSD